MDPRLLEFLQALLGQAPQAPQGIGGVEVANDPANQAFRMGLDQSPGAQMAPPGSPVGDEGRRGIQIAQTRQGLARQGDPNAQSQDPRAGALKNMLLQLGMQ